MAAPATRCSATKYHRPEPERYVLHHVHPLGMQGPNVAANRVELCDNCHYATHELLTMMLGAPSGKVKWSVRRHYPRGVQRLAKEGYRRITAALA